MDGLLPVFLKELVAECGLEVVVFDFVEAIHVELSHERVDFVVPEVFGKHDLLEFDHVFDHELQAARSPVNYFVVLLVLAKLRSTDRISKALKMNPATSYYPCFGWLNKFDPTDT